MKYLITTIAALVMVGRATTQQPEPPTAKAPDISIHEAVDAGNIEAVKQQLATGTDLNAKDKKGFAPLFYAGVGVERILSNYLSPKVLM